MSGFNKLIHEIHRRSLWQVLGIYVVGGWLVLQAVDTLAGALNLIVAYNFSMEFWVSYKLIGGFALTFIYVMITMIYLAKKGFLPDDTDRLEVEK